jgi:hypothetical protein
MVDGIETEEDPVRREGQVLRFLTPTGTKVRDIR